MWAGTNSGQAEGGGFIAFPGAVFAADPNAHMTQDGEYWLTYNVSAQNWLPVMRQFASPDGTKRLFFTLANGTLLRITDTITGHTYDLENDGKNWRPISLTNDAVYAMDESSSGLWRIPFQGGPVRVVSGGWWALVSGGSAWGFPTQSVPAGASMILRRLDTASGVAQDFATFQGAVRIVGVDSAGTPILAPTNGGSIITLSTTGALTQIPTPFTLPPAPGFGYSPSAVIGDKYGLWAGAVDGIYLFEHGAFKKVSNIVGLPDAGCI